MPARVSAWPFASGLWNATTDESGSNPNQGTDPPSTSRSPSDETGGFRDRLILVVEDSAADATLIRKALTKAGIQATLHLVDDGEKAMKFFDAADCDPSAPCPDVVLLDVNLPRFKGSEVLQHLRTTSRCRGCAVLVVSSSDSPRDREEMDHLGATGYFRKPSDFAEFMQLGVIVRLLLESSVDKPS